MSLKETIFSMMIEALELSEAVEVRHDRYFRSYGKKARDSGGGSSSWMFTHKPMGDVDVKNKEEVHTAQGKFADAKKSAQQWGKQHGHSSVYVMEEVDVNEGMKEKISGVIRREKQKEYPLLQNRRDVAATKAGSAYAAGDHKKGDRYMKWRDDNMKKEEVELDEEGHGVFLKGGSVGEKRSGKPVEVHSNIDDAKAQAKRLNKLLSPGEKQHYGLKYHVKQVTEDFVVELEEEVEQIDEISDEKKKEYIRAVADKGGILRKPRPGSLKGFDRKKDDALVKAFKGGSMQDYANLHKKSEKRAGIALNALNSLKKEEVELDEVSKATLGSYIKKASVDASLKRMKSDRLNTAASSGKISQGEFQALDRGANKLYKSSQNRLTGIAKATDRLTKEEVELDEAKTDIYHKHMLKALGKTRLPKDHGYTSAIANNGDFVVHNAGRVVGRIAKGEHDLK